MAGPCSVSLVLCTFNRSRQLRSALGHLLAQSPTAPPFELVVVDNNSTDDTRSIVEACRVSSNGRLCYLFEPKQGLSYTRNTGIAAAQGDIVAFTDDDVRVSSGWVEAIVRASEANPKIVCLGGRMLPLWPEPPPAWLTPLHWVGPLALQDYGDQPFIVDARRPLSLAGANLAIRKEVFTPDRAVLTGHRARRIRSSSSGSGSRAGRHCTCPTCWSTLTCSQSGSPRPTIANGTRTSAGAMRGCCSTSAAILSSA